MTYPPANAPVAYSALARRIVSTWSEEWKLECEVRYLAELPLPRRNEALDGSDALRGMRQLRGDAAVAEMRTLIDRYAMLRQG